MKEEAQMLPLERLSELNISVGYSGCLKGCGKHQHADIGLVGLRTAIFGPTQKSVRLFLGGQYTYGKVPARLILMAVPLHGLNDLLHTVLNEFVQSGYQDFEAFAYDVLNCYSADFLALWFLAKLHFGREATLPVPQKDTTVNEEKTLIASAFAELELSNDPETVFHKPIQQVNQLLWRE
jgi:ferredoxin-nitrite reductase